MEIAALSLACNIFQIIDFSVGVVKLSWELYRSTDGASEVNKRLERFAIDFCEQNKTFKSSLHDEIGCLQKEDQALIDLADRCTAKCERLIEDLNQLKITNGRRQFQALFKTCKVIKSRSYIWNITKDLESYRKSLKARLNFYLISRVNLIAIQQTTEFSTLHLGLQRIIADLSKDCKQHKETRSFIRSEHAVTRNVILDQFSDLKNIIESQAPKCDTEETWRQLRSLFRFREMEGRRDEIPEAYMDTFEWIFNDGVSPNNSWSNFVQWLESGQGIYWISGKLGSGKSTLMHYICSEERTQKLLKTWAATDSLIMTSFFFWSPGTDLQKTEIGMLRSIIFQILERRPALTPMAFEPHDDVSYFLRPTSAELGPVLWTTRRLRNALLRLLNSESSRIKFCFFIDGLDEAESNDQTPCVEFLQTLSELPNVKLCLSSRPWPTFEEAFANSLRLKLEDLTFRDIELYVNGKFYHSTAMGKLITADPNRVSQLAWRITNKASGVFLWVHLVVRSLIEGIQNEDEISELENRLSALPETVDALYRHMFNALKSTPYFTEACKLFRVSLSANEDHIANLQNLNILDVLFILDPIDSLTCQERILSVDALSSKCRTTKKYLQSRCLGFLEMPYVQIYESSELQGLEQSTPAAVNDDDRRLMRPPNYDSFYGMTVTFLHKTAYDFLMQPEYLEKIETETYHDNFDPYASLFNSSLVQMKVCPSETRGKGLRRMMYLARLSEGLNGRSLTALLNELDRLMGQQQCSCACLRGPHHWTACIAESIYPDKGRHFPRNYSDYDDFTSYVVEWGLTCYLQENIESGQISNLPRNSKGKPLLHCAMEAIHNARYPCWAPRSSMIQYLFESGADPNEPFKKVTPWQILLNLIFKNCNRLRAIMFLPGSESQRDFRFISPLRLFLSYGVDVHATFIDVTAHSMVEYTAYSAIKYACSAPPLDTKTSSVLAHASQLFEKAGAVAKKRQIATSNYSRNTSMELDLLDPRNDVLDFKDGPWSIYEPPKWKSLVPLAGGPLLPAPPPPLDLQLFRND